MKQHDEMQVMAHCKYNLVNVKFCKKKLLNNFEVKNCKDYELKFKIKTIKTKKKNIDDLLKMFNS